MKEIYLDNAATTRMSERALETLVECERNNYGNASSLHRTGQHAAAVTEEARDIIADAIGASPDEIYFTSGATEATNLALRGFVKASGSNNVKLLTDEAEHPSVVNTASYMKENGAEVILSEVGSDGLPVIDWDRAEGDNLLASFMHTNNETGTVYPVREIAERVHSLGGIFHCDAVQALGKAPVNVRELGIDMLSASAHKFHGPKGVGFLYVRKGIRLSGIVFGGEQERYLRPGTVNSPSIRAMAEALRECTERMEEDQPRIRLLRDRLAEEIVKISPGIRVNGSPEHRNSCTLNCSFPGVAPDRFLYALDAEGLRVSAGSACSAGSLEISHVIRAMGLEGYGAPIRFSLSRYTTPEEIDEAAEIVKKAYERLL